HAGLDRVFEVDRAKDARAVGYDERGSALCSDLVDDALKIVWHLARTLAVGVRGRAVERAHVSEYCIAGTFAQRSWGRINAAHPWTCGEREDCCEGGQGWVDPHLFCEHYDTLALVRLVGQRSECRSLSKLARADTLDRDKLGCLAVAIRNRSGLIEHQY